MSPTAPDGSTLAGQAACLVAALLWATAVTIFRGPIRAYGAPAVNLFKCTVGATLQGLTALALGYGPAFAAAPVGDLALVIASGWVGLTLGDTALFAAVSRIGGHRTMLLQTLAPVFAAVLAVAFQGEHLTARQLLGAAAVLAGVALVVARRRGAPLGPPAAHRSGAPAAGVALAVVAAFGQGCGVVLAKAGMDTLPVVPASFLRLAAASLGLLVVGIAGGRLARAVRLSRHLPDVVRAGSATLLGTYLALFLMMAGVALAPASIAAVLLSTSPVFMLVIERVVDRTPITPRAAAGTAIAVAGVAVLVAG